MCEKTFSASNLIESLKGHNLTGEAKALLNKLVKDSESRRAQLEMSPRLLIDIEISECAVVLIERDRYFSSVEVEMLEGETYFDTVIRHLKTIQFTSDEEGAVKGVMTEIENYKGINSTIEALGEGQIFTGEMDVFISKVNAPTSTLIKIDLTR
ncbi:hypothetical protein [Serratia sp. Se-RSBMAAmG]|uniref:hypothetical protein n=1 Tax=Serratia sp. Se-RSBMAAmG TaxID=3043305 RepID=UPI0024AFF806|nr:hypothetical protein [Serratia sp. Se-RSBMAAmG]MDI6977269.1 hypothetical protein [Serratia sp. Se-RSBMAAmG]